jgi:hypothetical protein
MQQRMHFWQASAALGEMPVNPVPFQMLSVVSWKEQMRYCDASACVQSSLAWPPTAVLPPLAG